MSRRAYTDQTVAKGGGGLIILTEEQQATLDGERGKTLAKVMRTLVRYGEALGADSMAPITGNSGHFVMSFGLPALKPVYRIINELVKKGIVSKQNFSVGPRSMNKNIPANFLQKVFFGFMHIGQRRFETRLKKLGLISEKAFTCTCYMDEVGNIPNNSDILSWSEGSAIAYANSVLGARCNRNPGIIGLFGSIVDCVPYYGFLTDEGRKASWIIEVRTRDMPEAQILGSAIGLKVKQDVPYIKGLHNWIGTLCTQEVCDFLKDMGAAAASNGNVGLFHVDNLTPEAVEFGENLILDGAKTYIIDDVEMERVKSIYLSPKQTLDIQPKICFVGCPHLSLAQLVEWTHLLGYSLKAAGRRKITVPTVLMAAPGVKKAFDAKQEAAKLRKAGVVVSDICPIMYMNNPLCSNRPVITNSSKLKHYTSALYYTNDEILKIITGGAD